MIRLQFSAYPGIVSRAIRWLTHSWCSHVDIVMPDGSLLGAHLQTGVLVRPAGYAPFTQARILGLPAGKTTTDHFYDFSLSQVGKPYDLTAILAFVANREWQTPDRWFCSELIAAALSEAKFFTHPLATAANLISPADLYLVCSAFSPAEDEPPTKKEVP